MSSRVIFGVANEAGTVKWRLGAYVVPSTFEYITFGSPAPQVDTWYCVELQNVADTAGELSRFITHSVSSPGETETP